jgi:rubrerythrin
MGCVFQKPRAGGQGNQCLNSECTQDHCLLDLGEDCDRRKDLESIYTCEKCGYEMSADQSEYNGCPVCGTSEDEV